VALRPAAAAPSLYGQHRVIKSTDKLAGRKGGGLKGERNGTYRTGRYTAEAKAERRQAGMLIRGLRQLMDSGE
jgi:hypothetical protein